jgi:alkanesulfonate monooxygenase SsuD/methylene tetrahydromethanopterin reductase-like flavin-dependent oxidoreductase (luciferase family)
VQFGLVMPNFACWFTPEHIRETLSLAEELGYESVWVNDHVVFPGNMADHYGNEFKDLLAVLPFMAACSTSLMLGTTVLVILYRPPIQTAKMLATIDYLSGGRLIVDIGSGHEPTESEVLGLAYDERGPMTDEYMKIMVELWTNERASFESKYYILQRSQAAGPPRPEAVPQVLHGRHEHADAASHRRVRRRLASERAERRAAGAARGKDPRVLRPPCAGRR